MERKGKLKVRNPCAIRLKRRRRKKILRQQQKEIFGKYQMKQTISPLTCKDDLRLERRMRLKYSSKTHGKSSTQKLKSLVGKYRNEKYGI